LLQIPKALQPVSRYRHSAVRFAAGMIDVAARTSIIAGTSKHLDPLYRREALTTTRLLNLRWQMDNSFFSRYQQ
jgi:hypothetical protein